MRNKVILIIIIVILFGIYIFIPKVGAETADEWDAKCKNILESDEFNKAIDCYNKEIELYPNYSDGYNNRGVTYYRLQQYNLAIEDYNKAIELNQTSSTYYHNRGGAYSELQQYASAIEDYNKAIELDPKYEAVWNAKGLALIYLGEYEEALKALDKALEINPDDAFAWNNKGAAVLNQGKYEEALRYFKRALELTPNYETAKENIIYTQLNILVESINNGRTESVSGLISPNARVGLKEEISNKLQGKQIHYQMDIISFEKLKDNKIKVKGSFAASGIDWNISGLSNYFIFEPINDSYLITDTDFHEMLGTEAVFKFIGSIFLILIPLLGFWLWMLIDCAKRDIKNKTKWILILIFTSFIGAILYYFLVRNKYKKGFSQTAPE